jgi:malonyl-CoA/methylmalonyl-CoA synthetase
VTEPGPPARGPLPDSTPPPALHPVLPLPARPDAAAAALEIDGESITYARLLAAVAHALAHLRARGVAPGERVALQADKSLPYVACHLACLRLGAVCLPLNPEAAPDEVAHALADSDARLHLFGDAQAGAVAPDASGGSGAGAGTGAWDPPDLPRPAAHDIAALLYTSGTTGRPKGVPVTHAALRANTLALHAAWRWSADDVLVHALPLFHVHGLFVALHGALAAGARTILLERFDAALTLACLAARRATLFMGVPTMYHRLASLPEPDGPPPDLSALRLAVSGSAPLRVGTAAAAGRRLGVPLLVRYGLTEALMVTSERPDQRGPRPPGGVGRPLPGVAVRVVAPAERGGDGGAGDEADGPRVLPAGEEGEVEVSGPSVFGGYWRRPEATATVLRDGWFATGDLGVLAPDGTLRLLGRTRELILSGGFNVYPAEVEAVLDAHPDVAESAVFGLPDADLGERVAAAIVTARSAATDELGARLEAHCRARLAPSKCPRRFLVVASLPRNALGKLQRQALADAFAEPHRECSRPRTAREAPSDRPFPPVTKRRA